LGIATKGTRMISHKRAQKAQKIFLDEPIHYLLLCFLCLFVA
jgi:hypothetical protein